jgi:hypothetical protein
MKLLEFGVKDHGYAGLSFPVDAATQTFAFLARKRAGKTYAAGKLCELLVGAGVQVVILDTVGNWYGLRLAADGKGPGLDIPVIGGLRGDVPLDANAGALQSKLTPAQWRILEAVISIYPSSCTKEELAERANASPKSSAYKDSLATLKGLGFLDYPGSGAVVGTSRLFLDGR